MSDKKYEVEKVAKVDDIFFAVLVVGPINLYLRDFMLRIPLIGKEKEYDNITERCRILSVKRIKNIRF